MACVGVNKITRHPETDLVSSKVSGVTKHGSGDNVYLFRFHYILPTWKGSTQEMETRFEELVAF